MDRQVLEEQANRYLTERLKKNIRRLRTAGLTYKAIGAVLGVKQGTVILWMAKKLGERQGITQRVAIKHNRRMQKLLEIADKIGIFDNE